MEGPLTRSLSATPPALHCQGFGSARGSWIFYERVTHADRDFQHEIAALQARIAVEAKQAAAPTSPPASPTEAENTAGSKTCPFKMFYKDIRRHLWLNP